MQQKIHLSMTKIIDFNTYSQENGGKFLKFEENYLLNHGKENKFFMIKSANKSFLFSISELDYYYLLDKKIIIDELSYTNARYEESDRYTCYNSHYLLKLSVKEEL